jgi:flavin reductase (DIM6/NTAB) family NADH-FMN oxidoreductase RutF
MAKQPVPLERAHRLIGPGPVVLVTAERKGKTDITPIGWAMPVSTRPPLVAISVYEGNLLNELIRAAGQFAINVPSLDLLRQVQYCGTISGRDVDKFQTTGLHQLEPEEIDTPLIEECLAHLECALVDVYTPGDHGIFVGQVVHAQAEEDAFVDHWLDRSEKELRPILHVGGTLFTTFGERLDTADLPAEDAEDES